MYDYIPGIRHGVNEQKALKSLYDEIRKNNKDITGAVKPLIEIVENGHWNSVTDYSSRFEEVFVDFPRYLMNRSNTYNDDVSDLVTRYSNDPESFYLQNSNYDYTPVISGTIDPFDHSNYKNYIQQVAPEFERICVRFFVPIDEYKQSEKSEIKDVIDATREQDAIMADVIDVDKLATGVRPNIEFIKKEIDNQDLYIFDLFEPRGGVNYNYGLVMGKHADVDGIGDFAIEPRFPQSIPGAAFQNIPKKIRQYESVAHSVSVTEDSDYYLNAVESMIISGDLDPDHCPACRKLNEECELVKRNSSRTDLGAGFVKQMRMNHYTYSMIGDEFPNMASAPDAQSFDNNGYKDIT